MKSNPYLLDRPALISVSGGRTSGFMLLQIIDAFGGTLPGDVIPVFCNTGREHEATLRFVKELGERWTPITWLEYRCVGGMHGFVEVDYCRASRKGEPFEHVIYHRGILPNPVSQFCTGELKVRTGNRFAQMRFPDEPFTRAVGLRYDEPRRVAKLAADCADEHPACPMHKAGHVLADVLAFWKQQDFDLQLPGNDNAFGNCDLCFKKRPARIEKVMMTMPDAADWWIEMERVASTMAEGNGRYFRIDRPTYAQMRTQLTVQGRLMDDAIEDDTLPCNCTD